MKKGPLCVIILIIGLVAGFCVSHFLFPAAPDEPDVPVISDPTDTTDTTDTGTDTRDAQQPAVHTDLELIQLAYQAAQYIKDGNYVSLSYMVHPEYGLVFSPYANVNLSTDRCFSAGAVYSFDTNTEKYIWGVYDGSGNPIDMTVAEYFAEFVFDADYTTAPFIGVDDICRSGNSLENVREIFPNGHFVDMNFPGTEEASYIDWSSLRFVFEDFNGRLMLTAIIHSEWTV